MSKEIKEKERKKDLYLPQFFASIARLLHVVLGLVRPAHAGVDGLHGGKI